jgi:hypothetical protein
VEIESHVSTTAQISADAASAGEHGPTDEIYCPGCNYILRGVEADRCPECGLDVVDVKLRKTLIPWVHRAEMGRIRAYWKTVWMVSFGGRRFAGEVGCPAHLSDAKLFRRTTIPVAFLPIVLLAILAFFDAMKGSTFSADEALLFCGIGLLGFYSCIALLTVIPFYALRSRLLDVELQHRTAVLCLYAASANLAWMFVACGLIFAGALVDAWNPHGILGAGLVMCGILVFLAIIGLTIHDVVQLIKQALKNAQATALQTLKILTLCIGGTILTLVGIPGGILFLAVVYYSLN